jgi:hypothetical protein
VVSSRRSLLALLTWGLGLLVAGLLLATGGAQAAPPDDPNPDPSGSPSPSSPPPSPPPAVKVNVPDLIVAPGYWQGTANRYDVRITITNTGDPALTTITDVALPAGLSKVNAIASGCTVSGLTFSCPLANGAVATVVVTVDVAPNAWRTPLSGLVHTAAQAVGSDRTAGSEDGFTVVFPSGPPTPGIDLAAADPVLPLHAPGPQETAVLEVRLRNTGSVQAAGTIEIVTPVGVQLAAVPTQCASRERLTGSRERCSIGTVAAGQQMTLSFELSIRPQARSEAPLAGTVLASLVPVGQDAVTVQAAYRIVVATAPLATPGPSESPDLGAPVPPPDAGAPDQARPDRPVARSVSSAMSVVPVLTALVGLFTVLGVMVILSLRRRLREEPESPGTTA